MIEINGWKVVIIKSVNFDEPKLPIVIPYAAETGSQ